MNIIEIVTKYLEENKFDGLFNEYGECACPTNNLVPCNSDFSDFSQCQPGYRTICDCGEHDFHILEATEYQVPDDSDKP